MPHQNITYAFIYERENGVDSIVTANINGEEKALMSDNIADIESMTSIAINCAANDNKKIKLAKYQKIQEIDFAAFIG
ncbi:MAG: hypothetical protein ACPG5L_11120 [Vibrio gallaecicus]|uniref:Uncharacterized protein n=2 Tax=Vibrio gallaecicus TaxID=552386 RepID=A0ABV4NF15_9VIBR|nr:hypothetical protein [Vibrio gallaecicus]